MEVKHEPKQSRFRVALPEGEGILLYRDAGPGVINLWHTEVDPALRGRGLANELARTAFEYARANTLRVIATCSFVRGWLDRHPEAHDLAVTPPAPR